MKSRYEIRLNFRQAMTQADRLDEVARQLENLSDRDMESSLRTLSSSWKGENASAFLQTGDILKGNIRNTAGAVRGTAGDIRTIARRIYQAEMDALRIASTRRS